ncbi:CHAT domain-containing protein [Candidatus Acetothermia bacterium]|nr:CHAT domain-containing protein [Candidatus Acetothermia bacterium]
MDLIICFRKADKDKNYSLTSLDNRSLGGFVSPLDVDKDKDEAVELRTLYQLVEPDAAGQLEPDRVLCEVGKLLFKALFVANTSLHEHYRTMDAEDKLVLQFEDGAESLLALPWEYLFDIQERTPVATVRSIVRRVGQTISPKVTEAKTPRALVVIAEPLTLHRFNARNVHDLLLAELEPLVKAGRLHLDFLALPITSERFARQLAQGHYDIVHFVGHGTVGGLAFEDEVGDKQIVDAGRLRALFDGKGVRFVFLTACLSAQGEKPGDLFTNTATALVRAGVGGVLAMQYSALVEPAFAFASDIYRALGEKPLEEAILTARKIRYVADAKGFEAIQWGIPALYLQTENGNLFPKLEETKEKSLGELHPWPKPSLLKGVPERDSEFVGRGAKMVKVNQALVL